jgi:MSHA biogenesis protein MshN
MSVSRRQLTTKELVEQKQTRAEKFLNLNEITKAEQLFEELLINDPNHKQARKKLAALWFGRQSYQQALNLLSQGISLDSQDGELRLMKARIHLKQGQKEAAYNTLKPLTAFESEEYQVMLANIAQQIEQYPSAIGAYQVLIKMKPYSGRWHLGLAIVYDKNSQFELAVKEYGLALTKADLSASSAKFAEQRMQALGE